MISQWGKVWQNLLYVNTQLPHVKERGQSLIKLLLLLLSVYVLFGLYTFVALPDSFLSVLLLIILVIVPSYVIARTGEIGLATGYFLACHSLSISVLGILGAFLGNHVGGLLACISILDFSVIVAAMLIKPAAALWMALANSALIVIMYAVWYTYSPDLDNDLLIVTALIAPLFSQVLLAGVCWLLTAERQRALQQVEQQTKLLEDILAQLPIGIAVYDVKAQQPALFNARIEELLGPFDEQRQARRSHTARIIEYSETDTEDAAPVDELPWETVVRTRSPFEPAEVLEIASKPDAHPLSIEEKAMPIFDQQTGELTHVLYVAANVSVYRALQTEIERLLRDTRGTLDILREMSHLQSELLANMSHELRTPLISIMGHLDLLMLDATPLSAAVRAHIGVINNASQHLLGIINNLLDAARLDAKQLKLDTCPLDLRLVVQDVIENMQVTAGTKSLTLSSQLPDNPVMVQGDAIRLKQVVYNLLSNAIKFTERGTIRLQMAVQNGEVHVAVQDTGKGITPAYQKTVFERFVQADNIATSQRAGAGLGLSISRDLIALHGGSLRVQSVPERGSTFTFSLPLMNQLSAAPGSQIKPWYGD